MEKSILVIIESSRSYEEIEEAVQEYKLGNPPQEELQDLVEKMKEHIEASKIVGKTNTVNKLTYALSFFKKRRR